MDNYFRFAFSIILAALLGGLIGYERENVKSAAGLRTHVLVCIGSCIVQLISVSYYIKNPGSGNDPFRMAAQVVSGIGFIGAGTIMKDENRITGLTTAASLWIVACIGIAIASSEYLIAIFSTFVVYVTLKWLFKLEHYVKDANEIILIITTKNYQTIVSRIIDQINNYKITIKDISFRFDNDGICYITLQIKYLNYDDVLSLLKDTTLLDDVIKTEIK